MLFKGFDISAYGILIAPRRIPRCRSSSCLVNVQRSGSCKWSHWAPALAAPLWAHPSIYAHIRSLTASLNKKLHMAQGGALWVGLTAHLKVPKRAVQRCNPLEGPERAALYTLPGPVRTQQEVACLR